MWVRAVVGALTPVLSHLKVSWMPEGAAAHAKAGEDVLLTAAEAQLPPSLEGQSASDAEGARQLSGAH